MKILLICSFFLLLNYSYSQKLVFDDFENRNFNKWDIVDRFIITEERSYSGRYSIKSELAGNYNSKLIKQIPLSNNFKIEFYAYVYRWDEACADISISLDDGTNGSWSIWGTCGSYLTNCDRQRIIGNSRNCNCGRFENLTCINFPMNTWNHIVFEINKKGNVNAWINNRLSIENVFIGNCPTSNIYIKMNGGWCGNSKISAYIDDIRITYDR